MGKLCFLLTFSCCCSPFTLNPRTGLPLTMCNPPGIIAASSDLPESINIELEKAVNYWNAALKHNLLFYAGRVPYSHLEPEAGGFVIVDDDETEFESKHILARFTGRISNTGCFSQSKIVTNPVLVNEKKIQCVLRHELGHLLGLDHNPIMGQLMSYKMTKDMSCEASEREIVALQNIYMPQKPITMGISLN